MISVISGCPGSGKTSLSSLLAGRSEEGVHLVTDDFRHYLSHPIDPSTPASNAQNTTITRAFLAPAKEFDAAGYQVYVDGVMHGQFERVMSEHQTRVIQTDDLALDAIAAVYIQQQQRGQFVFPTRGI